MWERCLLAKVLDGWIETLNSFRSWCDYNSFLRIIFLVHSLLVLIIIIVCLQWLVKGGLGSCWGEARRALSGTDALVRRWLMVSPSSWPVCLASADPSFLSCSRATLCHPPSDSAAMGIKAIPCWSQRSTDCPSKTATPKFFHVLDNQFGAGDCSFLEDIHWQLGSSIRFRLYFPTDGPEVSWL